MSASTSPASGTRRQTIEYAPKGAALSLFYSKSPEVVLSGPAGTGKSRACLEYLHYLLSTTPRMRALIVRKTLSSLTAAGLVTYKQKVLHPLDGVAFFGGSTQDPPAFRYPNKGEVLVGGMDKASKVMSTDFDLIYAQEATELTENDWESLTTRLRNGVLPYQQLIGDCNPDAPTHWLKQRADRGATTMLESRHEDNPTVTPEYLSKLDALTGVRYLRLRKGIWAAAEGIVYEGWDPATHLIDRFDIPPEWPRYWAVDFGYTHAFVCQWWAEDPDGRLYRYRELYRTKRLVEDHAADIKRLSESEPKPRALICDHDAEDRATLEKHLGMKTTAATKAVSPGIQAAASRLKPSGDGKPRLFLLRDSLAERDPDLVDAALPGCTEEELPGYVWDTSMGRKKGEEPVKQNDHGADTLRYMVAHLDLRKRAVTAGPVNITGPSTWRY